MDISFSTAFKVVCGFTSVTPHILACLSAQTVYFFSEDCENPVSKSQQVWHNSPAQKSLEKMVYSQGL